MPAKAQPDSPPHGLAKALLTEINLLAHSLRHNGELPHAEDLLLEILDQSGPKTVPQLARERHNSRQNIQILIDRLRNEGQVELIANPAHKRSPLFRLTNSGRDRLESHQKKRRQLLLEIAACASATELKTAIRITGQLRALLSRKQHAQDAGAKKRGRPKGRGELKAPIARDTAGEDFPVSLL